MVVLDDRSVPDRLLDVDDDLVDSTRGPAIDAHG